MKSSAILIGTFSFSLLFSASLTGCLPDGGTLNPADGGAGSGGGSGGGSGAGGTGMMGCGGSSGTSTMATWTAIKEVVSTCAGADCHEKGGDRPPFMINESGGGPLPDAELYSVLTTFQSAKCGSRVMVKPCMPEESAFYLSQVAQTPTTGCMQHNIGFFRMPFGCDDNPDALVPCTQSAALDGIRQWILNGAPMQ